MEKTYPVTHSDEEFVARTLELMEDRQRLARMRAAGLEQASRASWDRVFEDVYDGYCEAAGWPSSGTMSRGYALPARL